MPAKFFSIPRKVNKDISKFPLRVQNKIDKAFDKIEQNPVSGVKLSGELTNYYKFRVGDYRIIYRFDTKNSLVIIEKVEQRQGVYR